jgi:antitoxin component YwqK of YwqJK toxin-antitoxin module
MQLLNSLMLWVGLGAGLLLATYRLWWRHRYGPSGIEGQFRRLRGEIVAPGQPGDLVFDAQGSGDPRLLGGCFELEVPGDARYLVEPGGPLLVVHGASARVGDRVTVDAVDTSVRMDESHYRQSALRPAVAALRVARGTWPRLPALNAVMITALGLAAAGAVLSASHRSPGPGAIACPPGTTHKGGQPPRDLHEWCELGTDERWSSAVQDGVKHGAWISWWGRDRVQQRGWYRRGKPHGRWTAYYPDGATARVAYFDQGFRSGRWESLWPDGKPRWRGGFRKGRRHGRWEDYTRSGHLRLRREYVDGLPHGLWSSWHFPRTLEARKVQLESSQRWRRGRRDGPWSRWHPNGKLAERGSYRADLKHGHWAAWSAEGRLLRAGSYRRGQRHGPWRYWHKRGGLHATGSYRLDRREGRWTWWDASGRVASTGSYQRGVRQGPWITWTHRPSEHTRYSRLCRLYRDGLELDGGLASVLETPPPR